MNFESTKQYKKGALGEDYLDKILSQKGFVIYSPDGGKPHPFDRLCASSDKKSICIAEAKTKARRPFYPDTGINVSHYNDYMNIQKKYSIDVFLYFIDESIHKIYGGLLSNIVRKTDLLHKNKLLHYPRVEGNIIYFPLKNMEIIGDIIDEVASKLISLSTRSYEYPTDKNL